MVKVLWISNEPSPYKVELMNLIGQELDLTCLFEYEKDGDNRNSQWYSNDFRFFKFHYLKGIKDIIKFGLDDYDLLINSDYTRIQCILLTLLFRMRGKDVVLHADGGIYVDRGFIVNNCISLVMKLCNYYFSSGKETNKYFNAYRIKKDKILTYHFSSVNKHDLLKNIELVNKKYELRDKLKIKEKFIIISVGQQIYRKGYDVLLKSLEIVPSEIGVYIVGGMPEAENQKLMREHNLTNVHFIDFMIKDRLMEYYACSDVFILPTREDIWGLVINEAISFGLPIISTDKCVAAVQINEEYKNALIVPVNDSNLLGAAINEVYQNKKLRDELSQNSLFASKKYTIEETKNDFINNINKILGVK